ncbi:MAG: MFS transporter [Spirosomataceae bacterium]
MKKILSPPNTIAFGLLLVTLAVNVSMPLFQVYAENAGLSKGQTALVLAAYITGMLPSYIFLGGISDRLGRKPVLITSVFFAFLSTALITWKPDVEALVFARLCQGIALALSMGTGTAYMAELMTADGVLAPSRAANKASLSTAFGFSGGALATTLVLFIAFSLTPLSYYILLLLTFVGLILLAFLPAIPPIGGPMVRLPYFPKGSFAINTSIGICWAATGTIIAIVPAEFSKLGLTAYAGFCIVLINWTGAFIQKWVRTFSSARALQIGFLLVPIGFAIVVAGLFTHQISVILFGTTLIGFAAYGFSYVGGLSMIAELGGAQRARAVSGYMFVGYIGFGIPAVFLGYLSDSLGIPWALGIFEILLILLTFYTWWRFKTENLPLLIEKVDSE